MAAIILDGDLPGCYEHFVSSWKHVRKLYFGSIVLAPNFPALSSFMAFILDAVNSDGFTAIVLSYARHELLHATLSRTLKGTTETIFY